MAFNFWRKRDDAGNTPATPETENNNNLSDVLLTALMNGEKISRSQALTIPRFASDVDFVANTIASMPVKLYKKIDGKVMEIVDDSRVQLLNGDTGDTLTSFQFKKAMIEDYLLSSGGYAYIEKHMNEVTGLYYVENEFVVINYNFKPIYKDYTIFVEDSQYKPFEFIKLLRNTRTGAWGEGVVEELNDALQRAYQTQLFALGLVKTGGNKKGFLKSERRLGDNEIAALKAAWRKLYQNNSDNVVVLNNGIDFKEATNTSVEMQLNESMQTLNSDIDAIFHIKDDFYETFKTAIYPIIKDFENSLNSTLLLELEKGLYFFEFDVKEIVKANIKERYECYKLAKEIGFLTKNELRREENRNDIEGLDVIDFGLGSVLYDVNTKTYYTPNTNEKSDLKTLEEESIIDHDNGSEE